MKKTRVTRGVVLAGGRSLRFGSDKALASLGGTPLIARAAELIRSVGLEVCVVTQHDRDYSFLNCPIIFDAEPYLGPLSGMRAAFDEFPGARILALTCDMPFLTKDDLNGLLAHENEDYEGVIYKMGNGFFQPFPGLYGPGFGRLFSLKEHQAEPMQAVLKRATRVLEIDITTSQEHFRNINTKHELELSSSSS